MTDNADENLPHILSRTIVDSRHVPSEKMIPSSATPIFRLDDQKITNSSPATTDDSTSYSSPLHPSHLISPSISSSSGEDPSCSLSSYYSDILKKYKFAISQTDLDISVVGEDEDIEQDENHEFNAESTANMDETTLENAVWSKRQRSWSLMGLRGSSTTAAAATDHMGSTSTASLTIGGNGERSEVKEWRRKFFGVLVILCFIIISLLVVIVVNSLVEKRSFDPLASENTWDLAVPPMTQPSPTMSPVYSPTMSPVYSQSIQSQNISPTPPPSLQPTTLSPLFTLISQITDPSALSSPFTPQHLALQWLLSTIQPSTNDTAVVQRYAMATLYYAMGGDNWEQCGGIESQIMSCKEMSWMGSLVERDVCDWYGVKCHRSTGIIREINLCGNRLRGHIPSEIKSLGHLTELNLSYNHLRGTIPPLPNKLHSLMLNNNALTGTIPSGIHSFSNLRTLLLGNNNMRGTIPPDMFPASLQNLDLEGNVLRGHIPPHLFNSSNLTRIDFSNNLLSGTISSRWSTLTHLQFLNLQTNRFTGSLPKGMFHTSLQVLSLGMNQLVGTIPNDFFQATSLEFLDLGSNFLEGTLSHRFGKFRKMTHLILWQNLFSGTLPESLGNLSKLEMFQLPYNHLEGEMPEEVCALTPQPLSILSTDCFGSKKGDPPKVQCDCCNSCVSGYD